MRSFLLLFLLVYASLFYLPAQQRSCGTMESLSQLKQAHPEMEETMQAIEAVSRRKIRSGMRVGGLVTIPVVVHVVYNTEAQNISDDQIYSQIRVLNEDFRRQNPDTARTTDLFRSIGADTRIEFRLAERDPNGQPTSGITRTFSPKTAFDVEANDVKSYATNGVDPWPSNHYLNIWVCYLGPGMLGYAQFPGGPPETDGVVIGYQYFGTMGPVRAPFNRGRTATHEIGHWLNLRHIWGDGPCGTDDFVYDTPETSAPNGGCAKYRENCGSVDMTENFMDYTDDACMNTFTIGQAERMQSLFLPGGFRAGILESPGLQNRGPRPGFVEVPTPANLNVSDISETSASLSWWEVVDADHYEARFKARKEAGWAQRRFRRNSIRAAGLEPCTEYEFQVAALKGNLRSHWSPVQIFRTEGCPNVSDADRMSAYIPSQIEVVSSFSTTANLNWEPVRGATSYKVQYKAAKSNRINSAWTGTPEINLQGLEPDRLYLLRVRAQFGERPGEYSIVHSFISGSRATSRLEEVIDQDYLQVFEGYAPGLLVVNWRLDDRQPLIVRIYDAMGMEMFESAPIRFVRSNPKVVNIPKLPPGSYEVEIEEPSGFRHRRAYLPR